MMKNLVYIFLVFCLTISCGKKEKFDEGIYILRKYIDKDHFEDDYMETFLARVSKDTITLYATVNTWGNPSKRNYESERKRIINDSTILIDAFVRKHKQSEEFVKLKDAAKIIGPEGINTDEFTKYLNANLIAGTYKTAKGEVVFSKDGKIRNLGNLKTFSVNPRFGTNWWYDYRTIYINNELWKFDFTKTELILTKYLKRGIEQDAMTGNEKIVLNR
ncbi:hypothetical protein [Flavobacterium silvaticum]|uniref:Lipoprotein n=1 Tax=Flavobacterium silvaticum TaxID=1852020 RepID=A0A972JIA7_9FLAO|nr:hypothetical protein [Flavobacterium silvaticum]NMH28003.1 hypothetical protein [Flavobacterium silvaticum]